MVTERFVKDTTMTKYMSQSLPTLLIHTHKYGLMVIEWIGKLGYSDCLIL